jgi:hypothetical protein
VAPRRRRDKKQNVFDDFHAAGDWLVANGMASSEKLALVGRIERRAARRRRADAAPDLAAPSGARCRCST